MVKNIIFDLGGVIITLSFERALQRWKQLGVKDIESRLDPYKQSGVFGDLESGKISEEEFRSQISQLVGHEVTWEECQYCWMGFFEEVPQRNLDNLTQLRKEGYRLILLSNTNGFVGKWTDTNFVNGKPLKDYFDAMYRSYELKMMKPDEKFYRYVMSHEKILPQETIYIDDGPRNCMEASELGIATLCPKNGEDWMPELRKLLIKINHKES
ncbi:MAG: HAD family hydrolase [Prevotella sp.]|jgi:putative hydrolase of the HAD superfamily